jgi:hypothetical protein
MVMEQARVVAGVTYRRYSDQQRKLEFCDGCEKEVQTGAVSVLATMPGGAKIEEGWLCADCARKENV